MPFEPLVYTNPGADTLPAAAAKLAGMLEELYGLVVPQSGQWIAPATPSHFPASWDAGALVYAPLDIPASLTITHLGVQAVEVAAPDAAVRLALYGDDGTGLAPAGRLGVTAGVAVPAPGFLSGALGAPLALTARRVWIAAVLSGTIDNEGAESSDALLAGTTGLSATRAVFNDPPAIPSATQCWIERGVTGALPLTAAAPADMEAVEVGVRIFLRVA